MSNERRRFPMNNNFMKGNKDISKSKPSDILYGYLQMVSTTNHQDSRVDKRFVYKQNYSHQKVENHFGYDDNGKPLFPRRNIERAFRVLIQYGYIVENQIVGLRGNTVKIYELPYEVNEVFQYINLETLQFMLRNCHPNIIKLYIYFKYKHHCFGDGFKFTQKMLLEDCFGLNSKHKNSVDELRERMNMLRILGLIDWCEFTIINKDGKPMPLKRLTKFNDIIPDEIKNKKV